MRERKRLMGYLALGKRTEKDPLDYLSGLAGLSTRPPKRYPTAPEVHDAGLPGKLGAARRTLDDLTGGVQRA